MTDAYDTLREMLANVPDDAQVYVEELESIVEWPSITAGTFRALLAEIAGFEWGWEQREKAHDAETEALTAQLAEVTKERDAWKQKATDEESAHALIAGALVGNERAVAQLDRYRVERDQARAALKALSRTGGTE
jgi:hypothetical protein